MEKVELMYGDLYLSTNPIISDFSVTNISMEVTGRDINIALHLKRLNLTMWMTLFVPSMCLLVAAEITLFVNREHFQATIMVSLTANLVMFTIYNSIQGELPKDPHLKLIDAWFLHCLIMPMVVFILLVTNEVMVYDATELAQCKVTTIQVKGPRRRSGSLVSDPGVNKKEKDSLFIRVCQIVVPAISSIFTLAFFTVGFSAHH